MDAMNETRHHRMQRNNTTIHNKLHYKTQIKSYLSSRYVIIFLLAAACNAACEL